MSARLGFPSLAGPAPDAAAPLPIASQIEAHSVLQVLSEGPNGFVYLTRDATHGATRVLKEFMPRSRLMRLSDGSVRPCDVSDSIATSVARIAFMNEANTLAAFQHPALIRVLGVIPAHRTLYRVMPLVDGVSLEQHCRARAEPPSVAWLQGLVEGLLQALEVLHERRLGHGSVHPAQVMVRESGQPLLLGFASVARELDAVSPTPWQSPGAAHLTRHAPPVPADDLPALAETAYFAATGLQAPTLQQRLEGMPLDLRQALGALPDGPGDSQQRRRGLLLALETAFATSTHARPQSVAEFQRLLTGDAPDRGGRFQPTPRWVGEMPERDDTVVDLSISQPGPLSDDLPPVALPVAAAPVVAPVVSSVVMPPAVRAADTEAAASDLPFAAFEEPAPPPGHDPALAVTPERGLEPSGRSRVERDFAPTEFMVASAEATEALAPFHAPLYAPAPDTEPFIASLRPQPPRRARSPYAAMAALTMLALVGVGIAGLWNSDAGQAGSSGPASAQAPVAGGMRGDSAPPTTPVAAARPAAPAPAVAAAPQETPAPAQLGATAAVVSSPATAVEAPGSPGPTSPTSTATPAPQPVPAAPVPAAARPLTATEVAAAPPSVTPSPPPAAPPSAAVVPPTASRATRSAAVAAPPQSARPTLPQRTVAVAAARTSKPAAPRPSPASGRATAANADGQRTLRARSPLAACGNRTQFSLVYCMQQQCARPAYQAHPQCADLRNGG